MGTAHRLDASRLEHHVGEGVTRQVLAHVTANVGPHGEQHALALVVTGAILVGLAEIARDDGAVDGGDDLRQGDGLGRARQHVAAADAALGANEPDALQCQEDLLEVRLGQAGALCEVAYRRRARRIVMQRKAEKRSARVVTPR